MKKYLWFFYLFILLISCSHLLNATNQHSLWSIWKDESLPDTTRLAAIDSLYRSQLSTNADSAYQLALKQCDLAKMKNIKDWLAKSWFNLGEAMLTQENFESAEYYYQQSLNIREHLDDSSGVADCLQKLGGIAQNYGVYPKAHEYFERCLQIRQAENNRKGIATTLLNIAIVYWVQGNFNKAIDFAERSYQTSKEAGYKLGIIASTNSKGLAYLFQGIYDKAFQNFNKAHELSQEIENIYWLAITRGNIGICYEMGYHRDSSYVKRFSTKEEWLNEWLTPNPKADYFKALNYHYLSLEDFQKLKSNSSIAIVYSHIGNIMKKMGRYHEAIILTKKGLDIARNKYADATNNCLQILYQTYKETGNYEQALKMYEEHHLLQDSLDNEEYEREILRQEYKSQALADSIRFEKEKAIKELEIKKQESDLIKQRIGLFSAGGGIVLILFLAFTIYKGKKRSDDLLLNILPAETAKELKEKGYADAKYYDQVTVLFTDFKDFTIYAESMPPNKVVDTLNLCFKAFDRIIEKYGIEKIKTIGDAYMAAGGLPVPDQSNTKKVIMAALEMQAYVKQLANKSNSYHFHMRIGIHSGPVVAGIVGMKKFQYDIWGDTVNTAARMESAGESGKVNISQETYRLIKDEADYEFQHRGKINAKGKGKIDMYFVDTKH